MKGLRHKSIKELKRAGKTITRNDLASIFESLSEDFEWPRVKGRRPRKVKYGDTIAIQTTQKATPVFDLFNGKLLSPKTRSSEQVLVSFCGQKGPVIAKATRKKGASQSFKVPDGALSGPVVMLFPLRLHYGIDLLDEIHEDKKFEKLPCPTGLSQGPSRYLIRYFPVLLGYWLVSCESCADPNQSICPHGAIKFDAQGDCYVDQAVCRGQKQVLAPLSGNNLRERLGEDSCWDCFHGTETYSQKCQRQIISRVAHMDYPCCGCCGPFATVIPGYCFRELCSFNAITGGNGTEGNRCGQVDTGDGSWGGGYVVDKSKCTGCMMCYMNINCTQPVMKAYIEARYSGTVYLESISFSKNRWPRERLDEIDRPLSIYLGVYGQNQQGVFSDEIRLELSIIETPMELDKRYRCIDRLHLAIYQKIQNRLIPIPSAHFRDLYEFVSELRPLIGSIECRPPIRLTGSTLKIPVKPFGSFNIIYSFVPMVRGIIEEPSP